MTRLLIALLLTGTALVAQGDVTPPTLTMNFVDGNQVAPGTIAGILVWATDDIGIDAVDIWADGKWICHLTSPSPDGWPEPAPYECPWKVNGRPEHELIAQACDPSGNCASVTSHPVKFGK